MRDTCRMGARGVELSGGQNSGSRGLGFCLERGCAHSVWLGFKRPDNDAERRHHEGGNEE